jgi:exodeoxyribonuclease VII small subunit
MSESLADVRFEDAYAELEHIVRRLEGGDLPLADSVALYERGRQLAAHCQRLLDVAELRVSRVTDDEG